jgi:rubrerythrin
VPVWSETADAMSKSLFAAFSSEKEDSSFLKKRSKKLLQMRPADRSKRRHAGHP